ILKRPFVGGGARPASTSKRKRPRSFLNVAFIYAGNDLLSHTLSRAVQSALRGLTSVFGMGTGGTPAVRSPTTRSCQLSAVSSQRLCAALTSFWPMDSKLGEFPAVLPVLKKLR